MRDVSYYKPKGFEKHLTITELSRHVNRDVSWIRQLESDARIPKARRVRHGKLTIRLWSPAQVEEIEIIFKAMRPGRPAK
jgi:hypothetical protein